MRTHQTGKICDGVWRPGRKESGPRELMMVFVAK